VLFAKGAAKCTTTAYLSVKTLMQSVAEPRRPSRPCAMRGHGARDLTDSCGFRSVETETRYDAAGRAGGWGLAVCAVLFLLPLGGLRRRAAAPRLRDLARAPGDRI